MGTRRGNLNEEPRTNTKTERRLHGEGTTQRGDYSTWRGDYTERGLWRGDYST